MQNSEKDSVITLLTNRTEFEVGNKVVLKFSSSNQNKPILYCSNSYGSTLIKPRYERGKLVYQLPENISTKIGVINWELLNTSKPLTGKLNITPIAKVATMETYIGPPSIESGGSDYSMLVVIPTDSLDNPVPTNTLVNVKNQFLDNEETHEIFTKNFVAFRIIHSPKKTGRMLVSSECLGTNSKEFTVNVSAAIPTNFYISVTRPHNYADGNQITTFSTSVIKDKSGNIVSDGTFVTFIIKNLKGNILKTVGLTIAGVATSKMIHPEYPDSWNVKAYVEGAAESNSISLNYNQVIQDFKVEFFDDNRKISVGPLQSFMQQLIPDGLHVKLNIYKDNAFVSTLTKTSFNGYVHFKLKPAIFEKGTYTFSIETAGLTKNIKNKKLW
jgi:hypothetical protein